MRILVLALVPVLLLACGQEPAPVGPNGPEFSWMNNPDNGNLRISRYGTDIAINWTDPKTGLRATHTTFYFGGEPDCGPQEALDPVDGQDVGLPDFTDFLASWFHSNVKGEVWIIVRDLNQPGDCFGAALVGEGLGTIHYTENDIFAWYPLEGSIRRNDNTFGFMAQGNLTGVNGEALRYSGHDRFVWDPQAGPVGSGKNIENVQVNIH